MIDTKWTCILGEAHVLRDDTPKDWLRDVSAICDVQPYGHFASGWISEKLRIDLRFSALIASSKVEMEISARSALRNNQAELS